MVLTVCGIPASPFVRKIRAQLIEKGIQYGLDPVNPFTAGDDFTEISPLRRIPLLKDEDAGPDFILADSSAIAQYIERKYPEHAMLPKGLADYGHALWIEEYADTEVASKIGLGVFRPMIFPQMSGKAPDHETAAQGARKLVPVFDYLNRMIEGREWYAGDRFSLADIAVATHFVNLSFTGLAPLPARWPALSAFLDRAFARDSFKALIAEHAPMIAGLVKLNMPREELWA